MLVVLAQLSSPPFSRPSCHHILTSPGSGAHTPLDPLGTGRFCFTHCLRRQR